MADAGSRAARKSVEDLCAAHRNEEAHALHVASLAQRLFARTHRFLRVSPREGRLLDAACRLHDVGFARDPSAHASAGAAIIRAEGLRGFTAAQRECIAAAVELHAEPWYPEHPPVTLASLRNPQRALKLAAYLRIADGLDHSHLQDTEIASVAGTRRAIRVSLRGDGQGGNSVRAGSKADLWRQVFGSEVRFVCRKPAGVAPAVVGPGSTTREALRRLLMTQYRMLTDCAPLVGFDAEGEALHELRVALRRARALLRFFRSQLEGTSAAALYGDLTDLGRRLGPLRDNDVWVQMLCDESVRRAVAGEETWEGFLQDQLRVLSESRQDAKQHIQNDAWKALRTRFALLVRIELNRPAAPRAEDFIRPVAAKRIRRLMKRALDQAPLAKSNNARVLHRLRIDLRKLRLVAEFFAETLGDRVRKLAVTARKAERNLGRIHDIDVALARIKAAPQAVPRRLPPALRRRRARVRGKFLASWEKLLDPSFRKKTMRALDRSR
jgi:CHAD domain-containing protein